MNESGRQRARVTDIMADITAASREQSAGIEQVNQAIAQMDQVTQQNAALVEQAAAAAALQEQAAVLASVVGAFKLDAEEPAAARMPALPMGRAPAAGGRSYSRCCPIAAPSKGGDVP